MGITLKILSSEHNLYIFKECHPRCVGELDRWEGSQKHNSYIYVPPQVRPFPLRPTIDSLTTATP